VTHSTPIDRWLEGRAAPFICALVTALGVAFTWGSWSAWPLMHDEWAYWTQAWQYAANEWSAPAPPLPEFFEQLYILVTPAFASKYWPGHAILLAPGFAIGLPSLMPVLLSALTGGLVFALARRVSTARVAAITFVLWVSTFGNLRFRASYFSEVTTSLMWLAAWWALVRWRETRRWGWMAVLAIATGWGAISRPATMFVFAIPVGVIVIMDTIRGKHWRHLAIGLACGTAILGVIPLWSARTTGEWRVTPLELYTKAYLPFDVPGYTVDESPPQRALPAEMERVRGFLREIKVEQATTPAWRTFAERTGFMLRDAFAGWRFPFIFALSVGLAIGGPLAWFVIGSTLLLVIAYVTQAHTRDWTVYYLEVFPCVAFVAALGARRILGEVRRRAAFMTGANAPLALPSFAIAFALLIGLDMVAARDAVTRLGTVTNTFRAGVARLPTSSNVVFVRYAPSRGMHISLVANEGVLTSARDWIVHDLGAENLKLIDAAPNRTPYLYDEATNTFARMTR
jgi:hypothetical protein